MLQQSQNKLTALYARWSRDDGLDDESSSIESQRTMLSKYARENGFFDTVMYSDDGLTGTNFDRQKFNEMIAGIESGKVGTVIIKDLSRLGRNYVEAGHYTDNYFPDKNVRVIALEDNYDSANGYDDIIPFKHIMNEYYVKDISKKVKFGYKAKALKGEYTGAYAPYGYKKDSEDKHKLIIDEEYADIVKMIFELATKNCSLYKITKVLEQKQIPRPRIRQVQSGKYKMPNVIKYPYHWQPTTVEAIIKNKVYLGHMVSGKQTTKSYKNKKLIQIPESKWIIVENTHEPIIDQNTFDLAQKVVKIKGDSVAYSEKANPTNVFRGILRCSDCNSTLTVYERDGIRQFACGTYRQYGKSRCTMHYVKYNAVEEIVLKEIQNIANLVSLDPEKMLEMIYEKNNSSIAGEKKQKEKNYAKMEKRIKDLNILIQKVFEEKVLGNISEERANILISTYEQELAGLKKEILNVRSDLISLNETKQNAEQFLEIIRRYTDITKLSHEIVIDLIEKIVVHEREYENGATHGCRENNKWRKQRIDIYFRFVGLL